MSIVIFNIVSYLMDFLKLFLVSIFLVKSDLKYKKRLVIAISVSTLVIGIISRYYNLYDISFVYGIFAAIIIISVISNKRKIGLICVSYIIISITDMIIGSLIMVIFDLNSDMFINNNWLFVPINSVLLVIIIFICAIAYHRKLGEKIDFYVSKKYALLLIIGGLCLGIYVSAIQVMGFAENQKETMNIVVLVLSITSVVFIILASLLIIKENKNEQLKREAEMNNRLLEAQKDYYTMLFQKDEETRKFRHDINNHFYCMRTLLYDKNYDELDKYLSKLNSDIVDLKIGIHTGNRLVDVIANNIKSRYSDVKFDWSGKLSENMPISLMDLCTIFSNLLNNAFEAAHKTEEKCVSVSIKMVESQLLITVSNNVKEKPNIINGELVSTKNEVNHGYGIKNVRRCVENNNGTLNLLFDNNVFSAEVFFTIFLNKNDRCPPYSYRSPVKY